MFWILVSLMAIGLFYWKMVQPHSYWRKQGVKQGYQLPLFGDIWRTLLRVQTFGDMVQYIYNQFPNERFSGFYLFTKPTMIIRDPDLIRQIAIKDFDYFTDHVPFISEDLDPLWSNNIFTLTGDKWRHMRVTLSPAFTSSKMKAMFELMSQCSQQFTGHFLAKDEELIDVELKDIFSRYTNDVIATCAFGVQCDSLGQRDNEFYRMGIEATSSTGFWKNMKLIIFLMIPKLSKLLGLSLFSKEVAQFFTRLVQDTVKFREDNNVVRPDMIHLLMQARKGTLKFDEQQTTSKETGFATVEESTVGITTNVPKREITILDMTAQALIFFFAGFDSVSKLMCFMGHELAVNPDIQKRLQDEVDETLRACNGKLTYDALNKMKYLDMVVAETLRRWPSVPAVDRICLNTYKLPQQDPSKPTVFLNKGDYVWFPIWALHHDPEYYPNPEKFDPERFSDENKGNITPYTYLPFGVGPRNCIGSRFALLEAKTAFFQLLSKFDLVVTKDTQIPLILSKAAFNMLAEKGFNVGLKKRRL